MAAGRDDGEAGRRSLQEIHPRRLDIPALTALSLALLVAGQVLPVVTLDTLGPQRDRLSILAGVSRLAHSGHILLAAVIFLFSVIFPIAKLVALAVLWLRRLTAEGRRRTLRRLELLGKWSMLDVFVVVILAGAVQLGILAEAEAEPGVYVFSSAVLLSLVTTFLLADLLERQARVRARHISPGVIVSIGSVVGGVLFVVGSVLPLMHVESWVFWDRDYSLLSGTAHLFSTGEYFLGAVVAVFVLALPLVNFATLAIVCVREPSVRATSWLRRLSRWSMSDVFGLALLVVVAKLGSLVDVELRSGLWVFLASTAISLLVSWRVERSVAG